MQETERGITVDEVLSFWERLLNEVAQCNSAPIWAEAADDEHLLEWLLIEVSPVKWQSLLFWNEMVVPILKALGSVSDHVLGKVLKAFKLN